MEVGFFSELFLPLIFSLLIFYGRINTIASGEGFFNNLQRKKTCYKYNEHFLVQDNDNLLTIHAYFTMLLAYILAVAYFIVVNV